MLFTTPRLSVADRRVLDEVRVMREQLRHVLLEPRRWEGALRRNLTARAIRGSNSIEGYLVSLDDAAAAVADEEPLDTDAATWAEILGYRTALTYVQQLGPDPHFAYSEGLVRSLHFMMLGHDLSKRPGLYRLREVFVQDERTGDVVYEGPHEQLVPPLVSELVERLQAADDPELVTAAMAHLDLVMIHPFRDGNGRMARCLQTLVLARAGVLAPEFSSIEEYLGRNTPAYYDVLATVGGGRWQPERDASAWLRFTLKAHHQQAQTVRRRVEEASRLYEVLDALAVEHSLPDRVSSALYDAALGLRVRRSTYAADAGLKDGTASGDLRALVAAGLLEAQGQTKGRVYVASPRLRGLRRAVRTGQGAVVDPYEDSAVALSQPSLFS